MKIDNTHGHENDALQLTINDKKYVWHRQYITGEEVKKLADIPASDDLFLAIKKPWEDESIANDTKVDLARPGIEHFFSKKHVVIIKVNGTAHEWSKEEISFVEVIKLAFDIYHDNPNWIYTVGYEDGPKQNPEGSMIKGQEVFVKNKMIFHAKATDQS